MLILIPSKLSRILTSRIVINGNKIRTNIAFGVGVDYIRETESNPTASYVVPICN